jgi:glutamate carboxypeptidase
MIHVLHRVLRTFCFSGTLGVMLFALAVSTEAIAEGLSPDEQRLKDYAEGHGEQAVALLERVVNIPSATENLDGVREVGKVFRNELDQIGFTTRWAAMPETMHRAGHLVAEHPGTRGKRLLLIGHLDTVLQAAPFRREGMRAKGSGTSDMKGGDIILLFALKALQQAGALADRQILVVLTGDEEDTGEPIAQSRSDLRAAAARSDVALAFEGAIDDTATVARRGVSSWTIEVQGRTGHSSGILGPKAGAGAIFEVARILDAFRAEPLREKFLTINPSLLLGGTDVTHEAEASRGTAGGKSNVIPGRVVAEGDIRFISGEQLDRAKARMREVVARNLPQTSAAITFQDEYPAMAPKDANFAILRTLDRVSQDLGLGTIRALDPDRRGAGDLSFVSDQVAGLDGLGANGERSHTPDEFIELDSLVPQIQRAAILIYRLTR